MSKHAFQTHPGEHGKRLWRHVKRACSRITATDIAMAGAYAAIVAVMLWGFI